MSRRCENCDSRLVYELQSPNFVDYLKCDVCGHMGVLETKEEEIRSKVIDGLTRTMQGKYKRFGFK